MIKDLTGQVFANLTVVKFSHELLGKRDKNHREVWECLCVCGVTSLSSRKSLVARALRLDTGKFKHSFCLMDGCREKQGLVSNKKTRLDSKQEEIEFLKVKLLQALDVIESYRYLEYYDFPSQQLKIEPEDLNEELREMFPEFPEYKH